jgi:hypothetical protein
MIAFLGDVHGFVELVHNVAGLCAERGVTALIQVGDLGFTADAMTKIRTLEWPMPVILMDGNHEDFLVLPTMEPGLHELAPNCWYVGRGTVVEIDGRMLAFMGGADSIDKAYRLRSGMHWSGLEVITEDQIARLDHVQRVDLLVTPTPPQSVIDSQFSKHAKLSYGVSWDWTGESAPRIDRLWERLGKPPVISGHMHETRVGDNFRILAECELWVDTHDYRT